MLDKNMCELLIEFSYILCGLLSWFEKGWYVTVVVNKFQVVSKSQMQSGRDCYTDSDR